MLQDVRTQNQGQTDPKDRFGPVLIALGANLNSVVGPPEATILEAVARLSRAGFEQLVLSRLYSTPAFPSGSGPDFVNAALACVSNQSAPDILLRLHEIEKTLGRERKTRWGARSLDLDLLALGAQILPDIETFEKWRGLDRSAQQSKAPDRLILPHPRMQERAFVLIPLIEVAGDWRHPVLGQNSREMLAALPEDEKSGISLL